MSRRPKPAAQRLREGNAGKRPVREGWSPRGSGPPPPFLTTDALEFWNTHIRDLDRLGLLDETDRPVLVTYAYAWQRFMVCTRELEAGWWVEGSTGQPRLTPMLQEQANAARDLLRIATEFGATAAARARIDLEKGSGDRGDIFDRTIGKSPRLTAIKGGAS